GRTGPEGEGGGSAARPLLPARGSRRTGIRRRPDRIGGGDRPVAGVLAVVDEDALAVGHLPRRRSHALVADPPLDLLGNSLGETPHLWERQLGPNRAQNVESRRA